MAATAEEKFYAAVKVIRGLPKNGSFQPSHELMLKFYAYFKQATEGPCTAPKPGIWNLVNRKKWEAWSELGEMQKESAMLFYVDELKNIVETMPQTEQVSEFVETLGQFYVLVEEGEKDSLPKAGRQPNGSAAFNGDGDDRLDHSATIGEMLKINNNDPKKGSGDNGDAFNRDGASVNGTSMNGHGDTTDDDDDDDEVDEEERERESQEEERGLEDSTRLDSGSDTDEFCDTSDQLIQIPSKLANLQARHAEMNASTPVDGKRETRVRFAPHVHMADDDRVSLCSYANGPDLSTALHDISNISSEMMNERLGLGSPTGLSFLPQTTEFPPRQITESLHVNNSFSSLAGLAGNDSDAGDEVDEAATLDEDLTFGGNCDLVSSRGGGQEDGASSRATQGSYTSGRDGGGASWNSGRDTSRNTGGSSRRGLFPSGAGGGGQRRGGGGRQLSGSLDEQILLTLIRLQQDMTDISNRLASLELTVKLQREEQAKKAIRQSKYWPFPGMSKKVVFLLVVWPFLAPFIINLLCRRRRGAPR
ncbi:acyl-CoA-binding domain-containing protein 5-like isoform X2 [Littorina saxatilis]|uniref:ACB domain-containing protein n=1 Tax=Littorina saxatilis TaxID=31220 RepID=A0AAN9AUL3_9CAEN